MISEIMVENESTRVFLRTIKWIKRIWSVDEYCVNSVYVLYKDFSFFLKIDVRR